VTYMGERRDAYRILVGRAERKRPLERHRRRCEYNIKKLILRISVWRVLTTLL
jgi:hypothetical protein